MQEEVNQKTVALSIRTTKLTGKVLKTLFSGVGSLGDTISSKAGESFGLANSAAFTMGHAATYTYSGAYSTFANSNNWFNGLM